MTDIAENAEAQAEAGEATSEIRTIDDALSAASATLAEQESQTQEAATPAPEAVAAPQTETDPAPEHWAKEHKELYGKLKDPEAKALVREFDKTFHQIHQKRVAELVEPIKQAFAPYQEELKANGLNETQAVSALLSERATFFKEMQTNGKQYLLTLAKQYNIPLEDYEFGEENPVVSQLQKQVESLTGQLNQFVQQGQSAQQEKINGEIEAFASAKDEAGNPLRPHFDAVVDDMAIFIASARNQGVNMTLDEAYKRAVRANDEFYQQEVESQLQQKEAKRNADIEKAQKASRHLSGRSPAQKITTVKSVDDAIALSREQLQSKAS